MMFKKLSKVFCADNNTPLMISGGRAPVPLIMDDGSLRIYFASYDQLMRGRIYSLGLTIGKAISVVDLITEPIVDIGKIGYFDDNGIIPSSILRVDNKIFLYTIGFSIKNKLIFDSAAGLAISKNEGKSFDKLNGPVIDRTIYDPCFATSPCVINDNGRYKMWYVSCDEWEEIGNEKYKHYYNIKYKESIDGIHWEVSSQAAIDYSNEYEYAISRPSVIKDGPTDYKMWYSFRAQENVETYRIGYAESPDGIQWTRKDKKLEHFDVSDTGWDSEMVCYPYVFDYNDRRYMLYNGNGYGKTGFGIAVQEDE